WRRGAHRLKLASFVQFRLMLTCYSCGNYQQEGVFMSQSNSIKSVFFAKASAFIAVPLLLLTSGCSSYVSTSHGYSGHHGHVSVGTHSRGSGAAVVGALIVGGIIGSMINEAEHEKENAELQHDSLDNSEGSRVERNDELVNGYEILLPEQDSEEEIVINNNELPQETIEFRQLNQSAQGGISAVEWFQVGKDGNCYLMSVNSGVTNVVSEVEPSNCQ
ncbi:MAG: hypothetical protein L3J46_03835, partial [Kangiellaceae bacterium]|nr:hypothetical protein [Kangiellaceae bacterium]